MSFDIVSDIVSPFSIFLYHFHDTLHYTITLKEIRHHVNRVLSQQMGKIHVEELQSCVTTHKLLTQMFKMTFLEVAAFLRAPFKSYDGFKKFLQNVDMDFYIKILLGKKNTLENQSTISSVNGTDGWYMPVYTDE